MGPPTGPIRSVALPAGQQPSTQIWAAASPPRAKPKAVPIDLAHVKRLDLCFDRIVGDGGSIGRVRVDRNGIPLAVRLSAANAHDSTQLLPLIDAIPPISGPRGRPGRPRRRPAKLHGDKAYDAAALRRALRARGITPRLARRGIDSSEQLGRHRWVVERSLAWLLGCRRLGVRYERRADLLRGRLHLAGALICLRFLDPGTGDGGGSTATVTGPRLATR